MVFHEYLIIPKTTEQLIEIANEQGLDWNDDQVVLYNLLDSSIYQTESGRWSVKIDERSKFILEAIEKALEKRRITKIDPNIIEQLPSDMIVPQHEIIEVAISTGHYESPRENVIRVKRK